MEVLVKNQPWSRRMPKNSNEKLLQNAVVRRCAAMQSDQLGLSFDSSVRLCIEFMLGKYMLFFFWASC